MDPRTRIQLVEARKTSALLEEENREAATNVPRIKVWYGKLLLTIAWFMVFCAILWLMMRDLNSFLCQP